MSSATEALSPTARAILAIRADQTRACIKAICPICVNWYPEFRNGRNGSWFHDLPEGKKRCRASVLHEVWREIEKEQGR